jgi:Pentapeptide repeats (8 copies)
MPEPIVAYWEALRVWIPIGLVVLAALLLGIGIWWVWWRLPKREAARLWLDDPKARADVEDNFRKTVGQALGSVVVLLGAGVAMFGAYVAYLQFSGQQRASHDLLISNQVSKGFEQLGSEKLVVRLGGIYALEGVMNTSDQYHQAVLEALTAFVRENAKLPPPFTPPLLGVPVQGLPVDIQAALTVIGRRSRGLGIVDLDNTSIINAHLINADLSGAYLFGTDLRGAYLTNANLSGAILTPGDNTLANLTSAYMSGANLFHANLDGAILTTAIMRGVDLSQANLRGANLTSVDLRGANLSGADLFHANLTDARLDQKQLDVACGSDALLPPGLTLKPCPSQSSP